MLYQLSYALKPHYQVTTFSRGNFPAKQRHCKLLQSLCFSAQRPVARKLTHRKSCSHWPEEAAQKSVVGYFEIESSPLPKNRLRCRSKSSGIFLIVSRIVPNWPDVDLSCFPSFYAVIPHHCCTVTLKSHDGFIDLG